MDYKALYEQQLAENKKLKKEVEDWKFASKDADFSETPEELCNYLMYCMDSRKEGEAWVFQDTYDELEEENKKLKDFTNWENHPALKHKVVLDDDHYLQHLNEEGELIHPDEVNELKEALELQRKVSFWRMCETHNGFPSIGDTNLRDPEWIAEMNAMIEDRQESMWCNGTVKELQEGYLEFVGGPETEDEDEDEVVDIATLKEKMKKGIIVVCG